MKLIMKWLEDRIGLSALFKFFMDEPVKGGAKWSYVFGSALVFVFIMQVVSGVLLATGYSASATDAWGSVYYIQHKTFSGWFVRGMHNIGSSAMIVLAVLHMAQILIYGAYRKPRELNWISGVFMLFMIFGFGLTGYLLPWDQKGFWATQVATSIMGLSPVIGEFLKQVVQGGNDYGNLTLTRFYSFHVFFSASRPDDFYGDPYLSVQKTWCYPALETRVSLNLRKRLNRFGLIRYLKMLSLL